jgi:ADP-ribose pyrophosphatase YjhB (NUDIX family)
MPHIHEKIDFTVSAYIVYKDKVLLRKHDKYKMWLGPGGHIELDEDPNEAIIREAKEEVGLDIILFDNRSPEEKHVHDLIAPRFLNRHPVSENHEHIDLVYFATAENDAVRHGDGELSDEIKWFTARELEDPQYGIKEGVKLHAKKALQTLSA